MDNSFAAARGFLLRDGRLLERRLFAACFEGAGPEGVADAVRGYRNPDGGFGHALEPDTRCPASLPIYTEVALQALAAAGAADQQLIDGACEYLAAVAARAGAGGAVPPAYNVIESYPRAAHWTEWTYQPSLNPTAGLAGLLHRLGARHPWLDQATDWCWAQMETAELPGEVHALSEVFAFLRQAPDQERADRAAGRAFDQLSKVEMFLADPAATGYGLTPLSIAPQADSRWRDLFPASQIEAHLDRLLRDQQPDGGWPITWDPPSDAARLEWRGMVTLAALRTLVSYGRLDSAS
ncbi:MAG: hypothetical protein ACR2FU_06905 [Streptosporangiaceae bacterium]